MKISASIYSNKNGQKLENLVSELDEHHIDYLHMDSIEDPAVFNDIRKIRKFSKTPVDLHIISSEPEKYFEGLESTTPELVTFQYENLRKKPVLPAGLKCKLGLAIASETPVEVFEEYKDEYSFVLIMATTPGKSGGRFNRENFKKIRQFRRKYRGIKIHVDGGVNEEVSFILRNMGVYLAVTGSYLMNSESLGKAMLHLKSNGVESHYLVKDFMLEKDEIPTLKYDNLSFRDVLQSIEDYKMGFTLLEDEENLLKGMVSNADIRRGLLKTIGNLNNIEAKDIINRKPVVIKDTNTVTELLDLIKSLDFPILYLPVVDEGNHIVGAIKFNNLVKGES